MKEKLKILKDGNRITYILTRENENIPLVEVENGIIKVEKKRISDLEIFYSLIAALKVAVWKFLKEREKRIYRKCPIEERVWKFVKEVDFIEAVEALRDEDRSA